ncbi:MAG: hypothetical protein QM805_05250 [Pseudomonas sp.]
MNHFPSAAHGSQHALLQDWQALMRSGLDASRSHAPAQARAHYLHALAIARQLLAGPPGDVADDDRVAAFVVTHLNLAESLADSGQPAAAVAYLCGAHRTLMQLLRDTASPAPLQMAACRHSRETHAALIGHWAEHGAHPEIMDALRDGCMPFPPQGAFVH